MAKIDDVQDVLLDKDVSPAEAPARSADEPAQGKTETGKTSAVDESESRRDWHRTLDICEPILGALATQPGILASEAEFLKAAKDLSVAVKETVRHLRDGGIPANLCTDIAAPLCASAWQSQIEKGKTPELDPQHLAQAVQKMDHAMGEQVSFPVKQIPHIAKALLESPNAPVEIGKNFRDNVQGLSGIILAENEQTGEQEALEYFLARLATFSPETIGAAFHESKRYLETEDRDDVPGWQALSFWNDHPEDKQAKTMLSMALATQVAIARDMYEKADRIHPVLREIVFRGSLEDYTHKVALSARECADAIEKGDHPDLSNPLPLAKAMCTAMREGMDIVHDTRRTAFNSTRRMLKQKYPEATTPEEIAEALRKERWGERIRDSYKAAGIRRDAVLAGIKPKMTPMEISVSLKNRSAVAKSLSHLFKESNAKFLEKAFPQIQKMQDPLDRAIYTLDIMEDGIHMVSWAVSRSSGIVNLEDQKSVRGKVERVLQSVLHNTDVVSRCVKQGKTDQLFAEVVREMKTSMQAVTGMLPERTQSRCRDEVQDTLKNMEDTLNHLFMDTIKDANRPQQPAVMENEAAGSVMPQNRSNVTQEH